MKKELAKRFTFFCGFLITVLLLSACSGTNNNAVASNAEKPSQSQNQDKTTLSFLVDRESANLKIKAVAQAAEEKLGIKIEFKMRPTGSEAENYVKTLLAIGEMPDLLSYNSGSLFKSLNPEQYFVDLSAEPFMQKIDASFKQAVSSNGKVFGVAYGKIRLGGWLYNKAIYKKLGLSIPKTWSQLMENCAKIKASGKTAVIASYKDDWTAQMIVLLDNYNILSQDPKFIEDLNANRTSFASNPVALGAFEKVQQIYEKGYYNADALTTTQAASFRMLAEGEGGHLPCVVMDLSYIFLKYPDSIKDIGMFPQPGDTEASTGVTVWYPSGIYISKSSKNIDAAKKFLAFYISDEGQKIYSSTPNSTDENQGQGAITSAQNTGLEEMQSYYTSGKSVPAMEFVTPLKGPNLAKICVECGTGIKSPQECAEEYDKDLEKQAIQLGMPGW